MLFGESIPKAGDVAHQNVVEIVELPNHVSETIMHFVPQRLASLVRQYCVLVRYELQLLLCPLEISSLFNKEETSLCQSIQ